MFERVKLIQINDHIRLMNDADEAAGVSEGCGRIGKEDSAVSAGTER
ncbi:MAG: hypothetical protein SOW08_11720 [Lachnospiraceae bacterium]|nr:hypothetical protein [Lachnospiraceae bacterium]